MHGPTTSDWQGSRRETLSPHCVRYIRNNSHNITLVAKNRCGCLSLTSASGVTSPANTYRCRQRRTAAEGYARGDGHCSHVGGEVLDRVRIALTTSDWLDIDTNSHLTRARLWFDCSNGIQDERVVG